MPIRRNWLVLVAGLGSLVLVTAGASTQVGLASPPDVPAKAPAVSPEIRIDQLGFLPNEVKHARLMTASKVQNERFVVVDSHSNVMLRGKPSKKPVGGWNSKYHAVYELTFSRLSKPGRYRLEARGDVTAKSPYFRIASAERSLRKVVAVRRAVRSGTTRRHGRDSWRARPQTGAPE